MSFLGTDEEKRELSKRNPEIQKLFDTRNYPMPPDSNQVIYVGKSEYIFSIMDGQYAVDDKPFETTTDALNFVLDLFMPKVFIYTNDYCRSTLTYHDICEEVLTKPIR